MDDKTRFLNEQIIGNYERMGSDSLHLKKRFEKERKERRNLIESLANLQNTEGTLVKIDCEIRIKLRTAELA